MATEVRWFALGWIVGLAVAFGFTAWRNREDRLGESFESWKGKQ